MFDVVITAEVSERFTYGAGTDVRQLQSADVVFLHRVVKLGYVPVEGMYLDGLKVKTVNGSLDEPELVEVRVYKQFPDQEVEQEVEEMIAKGWERSRG